ncbi:unnamed protein product [Dracunculus medinensis]|uniref:Uncharacterized protein n=1 Tax=Dracunculus medinensis TaxID=318479 RepID=A0A3P7SNH6_DRAME|nr:unnamed protein product [Dracunculus medinensis]
MRLYFTYFSEAYLQLSEKYHISYIMQTSGTTGKPKEVQVPELAIRFVFNINNIIFICICILFCNFSERFSVTKDDIILFSTALSFDPSVVEMCLAATAGAKLVVIPDSVRNRPSILAEIMFNTHVTIVQFTPSILKILPEYAIQKIFMPNSHIRILIVGGESFPLTFLRKYYCSDSTVKVYNVYGVTEVSCWASCRLVDFKLLRIDIGEPIKNTEFIIDDSNVLLIGGSRMCVVNGKRTNNFFKTFDIVERDNDGKIYWIGRADDQIKINGVRVNLMEVVMAVEKIENIGSLVVAVRDNIITLFVKNPLPNIKELIERHVPSKLHPHVIVEIHEWPVTSHGKIDIDKLYSNFKAQNLCLKKKDVGTVLAKCGIDIVKDKHKTFKSLGMNSFLATEIMLKIEHLLVDRSFPIVNFLLSDSFTVNELLEHLGMNVCSVSFLNEILESEIKAENTLVVTHLDSSSLKWSKDLVQCIDSTPVVSRGVVFIGSHAGHLAALSIENGNIKWLIKLEGRIESTVAVEYGTVVVGTYDYNIYFLAEDSGSVLWSYKTNDIVKCRPLFITDGKCLVGSHDHFVYLLDYKVFFLKLHTIR